MGHKSYEEKILEEILTRRHLIFWKSCSEEVKGQQTFLGGQSLPLAFVRMEKYPTLSTTCISEERFCG